MESGAPMLPPCGRFEYLALFKYRKTAWTFIWQLLLSYNFIITGWLWLPFVSKATGSENSPAAVLFRARTRTTMKSESNLRPERF